MFVHISDIIKERKEHYKQELKELEQVEREVQKELEEERQLSIYDLPIMKGNQ